MNSLTAVLGVKVAVSQRRIDRHQSALANVHISFYAAVMGHNISGLLASRDTLLKFDGALEKQSKFALKFGFGFLPLDHENLDIVVGPDMGSAVGKFMYLTPKLIQFFESVSNKSKFAYIETEYFGGVGGQSAVVFRDCEVIFGPTSAESNVINQALDLLGLQITPAHIDAFAKVGLDRRRSNENFRNAGDSV